MSLQEQYERFIDEVLTSDADMPHTSPISDTELGRELERVLSDYPKPMWRYEMVLVGMRFNLDYRSTVAYTVCTCPRH